jgi:hypothetical protein
MRIVGFLVCIVLVTSNCSRPPEPASAFRFEQQIGIAHLSQAREGCMAIANASIKPDTRVTLADQGAEHLLTEISSVTQAIAGERINECDGNHLYSTELSVSGPTYYRLHLMEEWKGNGYAFVIVDPSGPISVNKDQRIEGDLDGDGTKESFRMCLSNEGAHYQVWTGEPLTGQPRWHWYVYAGYDTEANCTEKEYFGPK